MAESRRTRLTRKMIRDALIDLLDEHPLEKVTVKDICERADVNRSTFYAHYVDVLDLLRDAEDNVLAHVPHTTTMPSLSKEDAMMQKLVSYFKYIRENAKLFRILLLKTDRSRFNQRLTQMLWEQNSQFLQDSARLQYMYAFYFDGSIGMLKHWVSDDFSMSDLDLAYLHLLLIQRVFTDPVSQ